MCGKYNLCCAFWSMCCCWYAAHLCLPCTPLTGPGKRVCVMSAASVDWPYFRLQAARPRGCACPQRLSLPDLWGLRQVGHYHRPLAQRGKPHTHITMQTKPLPPSIQHNQLPVGICPGMRWGSRNIHIMHLSINYCVTQMYLVRKLGWAADSASLPSFCEDLNLLTSSFSDHQ